jgi:hypothetical protein
MAPSIAITRYESEPADRIEAASIIPAIAPTNAPRTRMPLPPGFTLGAQPRVHRAIQPLRTGTHRRPDRRELDAH